MIVVGTTVAPFKSLAGETLDWLVSAEKMVEASPVPLSFFVAIEIDDRGMSVHQDLMMRLKEVGAVAPVDAWTFSINDNEKKVDGGNRLHRICTGRNLVHEYAFRDSEISHVLFVDSDLKVPANCVEQLLEVDKPIVGGDVPAYCVDMQTEALTSSGWRTLDKITSTDQFLTLNTKSDTIQWESPSKLNVFNFDGDLTRMQGIGFDSLTTPDHRWVVGIDDKLQFRTTSELDVHRSSQIRLKLGGGSPNGFADTPIHEDELVELIGWAVTEGHYINRGYGVSITQSERVNPNNHLRLVKLGEHFTESMGATCTLWGTASKDATDFYFGKHIGQLIRSVAPNKQLTASFLRSLTLSQAELLFNTLMAGDGGHAKSGQEVWCQKDRERVDGFQMLVAMLGRRSAAYAHSDKVCTLVNIYKDRLDYKKSSNVRFSKERYSGVVWCPTVHSGVFLVRRNGITYWTGNCMGGKVCDEFSFPVQTHWNTAGFLLLQREVVMRLRWRHDMSRGATDDPCFAADALEAGFGDTYVRKDCVGVHRPLKAVTARGHDLRIEHV